MFKHLFIFISLIFAQVGQSYAIADMNCETMKSATQMVMSQADDLHQHHTANLQTNQHSNNSTKHAMSMNEMPMNKMDCCQETCNCPSNICSAYSLLVSNNVEQYFYISHNIMSLYQPAILPGTTSSLYRPPIFA